MIHFYADWAEQCSQINDVLDALSAQPDYSQIKFYKCLAEELSDIALKYKIEAVPTVLLFRSGKEIDRVNGADPAKITEKIKQYSQQTEPIKKTEAPLEDRLKSLINKGKVMLFMKGDRNAPRCGFSKQIILILNETGYVLTLIFMDWLILINFRVPYETFDILTDEDVRQGLKTYSDWPTYPQLYVKGELIGGLDIVKELKASGELESTLKQ